MVKRKHDGLKVRFQETKAYLSHSFTVNHMRFDITTISSGGKISYESKVLYKRVLRKLKVAAMLRLKAAPRNTLEKLCARLIENPAYDYWCPPPPTHTHTHPPSPTPLYPRRALPCARAPSASVARLPAPS